MCKSGCYINEQCMNHVMHADDICLLAPEQMLDVCFKDDILHSYIKKSTFCLKTLYFMNK